MITQKQKLKQHIIEQLCWDNRLDASTVYVDIEDDAVRLYGRVPHYAARTAAIDDVRLLPGVCAVRDELSIESHDPLADGPSNRQIRMTVCALLDWNPDIDASRLNVEVIHGYITLTGTQGAYWKKQEAERVATNVAGVVGITNAIMVQPNKTIPDTRIAIAMRAALKRRMGKLIKSVEMDVFYGTVTLSGSVENNLTHDLIWQTACLTDGVVDIVDALHVTPR